MAWGLADMEVISQPEPTSCIHVPMFEAMLAIHNHKNTLTLRGFQGEATGCSVGMSIMSSAI
jgi:hypothetical protein